MRQDEPREPNLERGESGAPADGGAQRFAEGMGTRRAVLGDAHVDRASAAADGFDGAFQRFITEQAWGAVWSRPGLTRRERSLITIALLAGLGHREELAMHVRAAENTGASADDIREALLHVAVYAGVPAANAAFKTAKTALTEWRAARGGATAEPEPEPESEPEAEERRP